MKLTPFLRLASRWLQSLARLAGFLAGRPRAEPGLNVIVIDRRPSGIYVFMYEDGRELEAMGVAGRWAMSGIGFRWADAAEVGRRMDTQGEA